MEQSLAAKHHEERRAAALAMGGEAKLARRRAAGVLNVRERVDLLVDEGTFHELGLYATSPVDEIGRAHV